MQLSLLIVICLFSLANGLDLFAELYMDPDIVFFGYMHIYLHHVLEYVFECGAFIELYRFNTIS